MSLLSSFRIAASFLTRFAPAPLLDDTALAHSVRWYGLVGALLGGISVLPFWLLTTQGLWNAPPLLMAWGYAAFMAWSTRALHWDGLADFGDALGSARHGAEFWRILHDSTLGAFGAITVIFTTLGLILAAHAHITHGHWLALVAAPAAGRCGAVLLAGLCPPYNADSLGGRVCSGVTRGVIALHCAIFLAALWVAGGAFWLPLLGCAGILCYVYRAARREGGINGDMMGTVIVLWETAFLLTV